MIVHNDISVSQLRAALIMSLNRSIPPFTQGGFAPDLFTLSSEATIVERIRNRSEPYSETESLTTA